MKTLTAIIALLALTGCEHLTPTTSYMHMSDPSRERDGRDLLCQGLQLEQGRLEAKASACANYWGGEYVVTEFTYHWTDR